MSDLKKDSVKKFKREYPRTEKGLLDRTHGYHYLKYINLYIYHTQNALNKFKPNPDKLKYPEGKEYEVVDDAVKMFVEHTGAATAKQKTNDYHAKVVRVEDANKLFELHQDLDLPELPKTVLPYELARRALIKEPDSICVIDCPCRTARGEEGCYPRDVCIILGEPWVTFVLENAPESKPRRITQEEALAIVKDQHERGNVQSAFFKSALNDRLYALCNCCSCCCTALMAHKYSHAPMFATSGYKAVIDQETCVSCNICADICHFDAIENIDGKMMLDNNKCYGCGVCESKCLKGAITMIRDDPSISEPFDLDVLMPEAMNTILKPATAMASDADVIIPKKV
jgi:ferredoxin